MIKCEVVAEKVWHSKENRFLATGEGVDFPAEVKNHEGKLVPFKVGPSFKVVEEKPAAAPKGNQPPPNGGNADLA